MKKPTMLKFPERPKKSASIAVKEKYVSRCGEVEKENKRRLNEYNVNRKRESHLNGVIYKNSFYKAAKNTGKRLVHGYKQVKRKRK